MNTTSNLAGSILSRLSVWLACLSAFAQESGQFSLIETSPNRDVTLRFMSPAGSAWRLEASGNLVDWEGWRTFGSTGADDHVDSGAAYRDHRFFRAVEVAAASTLTGDHLPTARGDLVIHPVNHATLVLGWDGRMIYVDPVGGAGPFQGLPRADLILITHQHGDHLDAGTINSVRGPETVIVAPPVVYSALTATLKALTKVLPNGASTNVLDLTVEAIPAYNLTASHHAKGAGNGYVVTLGGKRIYVSGDTEDIPEMRTLRDIDVAFVSMNLPYTMSVSRAVSAVREFRPKVVYPYHYKNADGSFADLETFKQQIGTDLGIEVRLRLPLWY
jgi:L-ascorbate metabolism protein UlaG (beta-lactamase superfamily)